MFVLYDKVALFCGFYVNFLVTAALLTNRIVNLHKRARSKHSTSVS